MEIAPFLVPITLFVSIAAVAILRGPLGKALADRMSGRALDSEGAAEIAALLSDYDELRARLAELEERLDFTERLLAQQERRDALPPEQP